MKEKPIVAYYVPVGCRSGEKIVGLINGAGFFCILHPVDMTLLEKIGASIGGSSAEYHVVDLGEKSVVVAKSIANRLPGSKGRILVVEPQRTPGLDQAGLISAPADRVVAVLQEVAK